MHLEIKSLPSRERGLKFHTASASGNSAAVAPLAGAWIEISISSALLLSYTVAPLAGAWIEIEVIMKRSIYPAVAPLAGAWIEIDTKRKIIMSTYSRSPRGSVD